MFNLDENIASNWDLYLITVITILFGAALYFRRPVVSHPANNLQAELINEGNANDDDRRGHYNEPNHIDPPNN